MSREYAKRSRGGGNLPLIIAIVGTVIVVAVILYFLLSSGGGGLLGPKETDTPPPTYTPNQETPTPGLVITPAPSATVVIVIPSEAPSAAIITDSPTPTPPKSYASATVWASTLNVREGPGLDYAKVGSAKHGQIFTVLEETTKFLKVQLPSGVYGWGWRDYFVRGDASVPAAPTSAPDPSMMKSASITGSTIRVTFTENVWGNSAKTAAVAAAAFEVKEGTTTVAISAITTCQGGTYVDLTIGSTSGGTLSVKLTKDGVYNTDSEGTNAGTISLGEGADSVLPTASMSDTLNKVTVTFSEAVFTDSDGTGDLVAGDFNVYADMGSPSIGGITKSGNAYEIVLTYSGISNPQIADTTFKVLGSSVYDAAGNACGQTTYTFDYAAP